MELPNAYEHKQLKPGQNIRVLALQPARQAEEPIRCSLREICLDNITTKTSPYEALSYVWGAPTGDCEIICEGKVLLVTANCVSALKHLRYGRKERILWVDAICINQKSESERNHQVKLFGEVYQRAKKVIAWLGVGSVETPKVVKRIKFIGRWVEWENKSYKRWYLPPLKSLRHLIGTGELLAGVISYDLS